MCVGAPIKPTSNQPQPNLKPNRSDPIRVRQLHRIDKSSPPATLSTSDMRQRVMLAPEYAVFQPATMVPDRLRRPHIFTGYRQDLTWAACFASVFRVHNETLNIWSHLVGLAIFIAVHYDFSQSACGRWVTCSFSVSSSTHHANVFVVRAGPDHKSGTTLDRRICDVFFVSCQMCMAFRYAGESSEGAVRGLLANVRAGCSCWLRGAERASQTHTHNHRLASMSPIRDITLTLS